MATNYTLSPSPWLTFEHADGSPVSGGQLYTFQAGQGPAATTYLSSSGTPNTNPIILDAAGRASIFLAPGSYFYALYDSVANGGALIKTQDNIAAIGGSTNQQTIPGIAGATLTDGQVCYLSDGSGALTVGRWYPAQANNAYSSTTPYVAFVIGATTSGTIGAFLPIGQVISGITVTVGLDYFIDASTPGAITSTPPALARYLGRADSGTSLDIAPNPPIPNVDNTIVDGRLTLTTLTPVTTADVTAATTLFFSPYKGSRIALYSGTTWQIVVFAEISIAVPATTSQMYDVFCFNNGGVATLEVLAWTNDTTRATALVLQDGVLCKTAALTRRYMGSFRTTTVSGQTEDSFAKRYVWNYYNRLRRDMRVLEATASWVYSTLTYRQARATATNQLDYVLGVAEESVFASLRVVVSNDTGTTVFVAIGLDSTTTPTTNQSIVPAFVAAGRLLVSAQLDFYSAIGRHTLVWLEESTNLGVTTWFGNNGDATTTQSGIFGWIQG